MVFFLREHITCTYTHTHEHTRRTPVILCVRVWMCVCANDTAIHYHIHNLWSCVVVGFLHTAFDVARCGVQHVHPYHCVCVLVCARVCAVDTRAKQIHCRTVCVVRLISPLCDAARVALDASHHNRHRHRRTGRPWYERSQSGSGIRRSVRPKCTTLPMGVHGYA